MRQSKAWPVLCSQSRGEGAGLARGEAREAEGRPGGDLHAPHTHTHTLLPRVSLQTWARDSYRVWDGHVYTWITNKDLLYSTENSAQWYVAAWLGWQFVGEWIHVYVWLRPFAVQLKLSQHCLLIGYTPIQNEKFF